MFLLSHTGAMKYVFGLSIEKLSAPLFHSSFKAKNIILQQSLI